MTSVAPNIKTISVSTAGIYIRTQLQLIDGQISLNGQNITIENGKPDAILRQNGFIKNSLATGAFIIWKNMTAGNHVFPFGISNTKYIPVSFMPTSGIGGDVSITTYSTGMDNWPYPLFNPPLFFRSGTYPSTDVIDRWRIVHASGTADVTLSYASGERTIAAASDSPLGVIQWTGSGWTFPLGNSNPTINSIGSVTLKHTSMFTAWSLATKEISVSYDLATFNGEQIDNLVYLKWVTASEFNSANFSVERSTDGIQFEEISEVKASGTSDSPLHYSSIDRNPIKGTALYR